MGILESTRTILKRSPGIKACVFVPELHKKTGKSRSTIYEHLDSFEIRHEIYREKGRYWLEDPKRLDDYNKDMRRHARDAVRELAKHIDHPYRLLLMYDSGEFEVTFPELAEHIRKGYPRLASLFGKWKRLPNNAKEEDASSNSEPTEAHMKAADFIINEVGRQLGIILRRANNGYWLEGKCTYCPRRSRASL